MSIKETLPALPVVLMLDNIRSLLNVGAIFRTSEAINLEKLILAGITPTPPRHEISKTALGAAEVVDWEYVLNPLPVLRDYQARGYKICALEQTERSIDLFEAPISFPMILVAGHEKVGVSPEVLALADSHLELPMRGQVIHSLNVGMAVGVALYELSRRYFSEGGMSA